jgi:hypothetical protein
MGLRKQPFAFTEHGAVAAAFVLNSPAAVAASVQIVRAFVRLREVVATYADLAAQASGADFGHAEGGLGLKARGSSVHAEAHRSEATLSSL